MKREKYGLLVAILAKSMTGTPLASEIVKVAKKVIYYDQRISTMLETGNEEGIFKAIKKLYRITGLEFDVTDSCLVITFGDNIIWSSK